MKCFKHVRYSIRIVAMLLLVATLCAVEFNPSAYGYGTYTIKIVYESLNNSTDSFSVAWY